MGANSGPQPRHARRAINHGSAARLPRRLVFALIGSSLAFLVSIFLQMGGGGTGIDRAFARSIASGCAYRVFLPNVFQAGPGSSTTPVPTTLPCATLAPTNLTLTPNLPSGQSVGMTVTWTASATDSAPLEYRFSIVVPNQAPTIVRDFEPSNSFSWTSLDEGSYTVQVTVHEAPPSTAPAATLTSSTYQVISRVSNGQPVISPTANPLIALYSIPPCGTGTVKALFGTGADVSTYQATPSQQCSSTLSTNFYIVGMQPSTTYTVESAVTGASTTYGPTRTITTGALPTDVSFPSITEPVSATNQTSLQDSVVFRNGVDGGTGNQVLTYATDLSGKVLWYLAPSAPAGYIIRPLVGGNDIAIITKATGGAQVLQILDPLGNPVRETTTARINEQLAAMTPAAGHSIDQIRQLHHEVNLLPNGHIVVFGNIERLFPPHTQGATSAYPVDILTDEVIDLDQNLQVDWTWNTFDYLDINRPAVLGETCAPAQLGCPTTLAYAAQAGGTANDWTHSNAIAYSATDHNLLISMRHQDWILKVNYQDATGDGHVLWRLGKDGDFTLKTPPVNDPFPWFSHQHGIEINSSDVLGTFDDGNTRCNNLGSTCHSRGQIYQLDEVNKTATLKVDADMGNYSFALGWVQTLQNGDYAFTSGFQLQSPPFLAQNEEFDPTGATKTFVIQDQPEAAYRIYRMPSMYAGCCGD